MKLILIMFACLIAGKPTIVDMKNDALVIQGKVISFNESFPLEGVLVQVKGTSTITGTQADGTYSLEIRPIDTMLVFSLSGYERQEVRVMPDKREYDIALKPSGQ
ncbi:carboxypeptidase-like regulatory domain-containing protein [Flavihumibacter rivuli]|uniref:carboxypeptidase-like regulatory domain-containing protein n=1 Tax=Flavihumibacter rivuli TaxID=2838156 RepID=UPI001BDE37AF|nr:carboxypeptidase-like regulatory domain-containing protein [Flavihumibacter rivuli]ULQ55922.1 carboxypeptidase-like regulatory domain-containing protein [Flavihumibacter rivuli]